MRDSTELTPEQERELDRIDSDVIPNPCADLLAALGAIERDAQALIDQPGARGLYGIRDRAHSAIAAAQGGTESRSSVGNLGSSGYIKVIPPAHQSSREQVVGDVNPAPSAHQGEGTPEAVACLACGARVPLSAHQEEGTP